MATITICNRSKKSAGFVKLRFRLSDGRDVQLYHKSEIIADLRDLEKFNADGSPVKRANYNRDLHKQISDRVHAIRTVYADMIARGVYLSAETFNRELERYLRPYGNKTTLLDRFRQHIEACGLSEGRKQGYRVFVGILERFLTISRKMDITPEEVDREFIADLRDYIDQEWRFVGSTRWGYLFADLSQKPKPRTQNTISAKLKILKAFFEVLKEAEEISRNPFDTLGREARGGMLRENYGEPIPLTLEEVKALQAADVPEELKETRDAFLILCALGCRVGELARFTPDNIKLSPGGVPFVVYQPEKEKTAKEIKTPIVKFAFDILRRRGVNFPISRNTSGERGFNKLLKRLFAHCGLTREVREFRQISNNWINRPLAEVVSTKTGRKTFVTLSVNNSVDLNAAGLHAEGSKAVKHYYADSIEERFKRLSASFDEPLYKVSEEEFRQALNRDKPKK